jgi:hypothetical protein
MRAGWLTVALALTVLGTLAAPGTGLLGDSGRLGAQNPADKDATGRVGCLRGQPLPTCKSFWIMEMQGYTPLAQTTRQVTYGDVAPVSRQAFESNLEWNLGHMVNLTPNLALGGTLSIGPTGGTGIFTGARLRARRWMSRDWSLELSGGLLDSNMRYPGVRGATFDARVNIRDQGAFFVRWDGASLSRESFPEYGHFDPGGFQQAFSIGAAAGSVPALVGTGALGLGYLILLGVYLSDAS